MRTVVLVHGAWHGSWCWQRLVPELEARGLRAVTLDLPSVHAPLCTRDAPLSADARAVRGVLDSLASPVILLGHSYGGMVISHAGHGARIAHLVYLCAFVPAPGESVMDLAPARYRRFLRIEADGRTLPDPAQASHVLYGDCDPDTQRWACARLRPHPLAAFSEPVALPGWRELPSTYVVCSADQAIAPSLQRERFAQRLGAALTLEAGHSPFLSRPAALAELLAAL